MSLKITKASEPIEVTTITVCLYAVPGVGKTTTAFTAEKPLLLDFDRGSYRAGNRGDVVQIERWSDVESITAADLSAYKTLVVDTAGRALDCLTAEIIASNPKMGRGGSLSLQGYGELKSRFIAWAKLIRSFGLDVVLLAHSDEQRQGDELIERLDMQGGSKNEVYKASDVMGRIYLAQGARTLNLSPSDTAFGKNPAQLAPLPIPDYAADPAFLAGVIARTKSALNRLSEVQARATAALAEWQARIAKAASLTDFDALLPLAKDADPAIRDNVKRMVVKAAKARGFAFSKATGAFDLAPPAVEKTMAAEKGSKAA